MEKDYEAGCLTIGRESMYVVELEPFKISITNDPKFDGVRIVRVITILAEEFVQRHCVADIKAVKPDSCIAMFHKRVGPGNKHDIAVIIENPDADENEHRYRIEIIPHSENKLRVRFGSRKEFHKSGWNLELA